MPEAYDDVVRKIRLSKKGAVISFSSTPDVALSLDSFTDFRLYEGKEVSALEMRKILSYAKADGLYEEAIRLLRRKRYTSHELRAKLSPKSEDKDTLRRVIFRLKEKKLLDDESYAREYAEEMGELKKYGKKKILFSLQEKGIDPQILASLPFGEEEELARAKDYLSSWGKGKSSLPSSLKKRKAMAALLAHGFEEETAKEALSSLSPEDEEAVEEKFEKDYRLAKAHYERKYQGSELKSRMVASLARKGYPYESILRKCEEDFE